MELIMKQTSVKYYCDRCGKEIEFRNTFPTVYYHMKIENDSIVLLEWSNERKDLCNECGKKLKMFLDGAKLADE